MKFRVKLKRTKYVRVFQRLEDRTIKFVDQIDFSFDSIAKSEPQGKSSNVTDLYQAIQHCLLQWGDGIQRFSLPGKLPISFEFLTMKLVPLKDMSKRPPGEPTFYHPVSDSNRNLVLAICSMEMWWLVIPV